MSARQHTPRRPALIARTHAGSETEPDHLTPGVLSRQPSQDVGDWQHEHPTLTHRLRTSSSILAIVLSDEHIYAGTQSGEILVYEFSTYEQRAVIEGHRGSVLGLCLSADQKMLFSGARDRMVNVWGTHDLTRISCIYSSYDVGDIFCVVYSSALKTLYLGAQNTTIQWCSPEPNKSRVRDALSQLVSKEDPFFDSRGPGGVRTPKPADADFVPKHARGGDLIEIGKENVRHFAHYGYVYSMLLAKEGVPEAGGKEVLVTGGGDGVVKLWTLDAESGGAIKELYALDDGREEGHSVLSLAVDGTLLYSGRTGGELDVWDLETRQLVRNLKAHRDDVLAISVGDGYLLSAAVTGFVRKFDRQYTLKSRHQAHDGRILSSAFTYHRRRPIYVTGGNDNTLAIWDVTNCVTVPTTGSKTNDEFMLDSLRRFVSYKTVSSDARHQLDCRRGASFLRSVFKNFGAITEMLPTEETYNPVILARFRGNPATASKRKNILFYGHYDVVAADNHSNKWIADPFSMEGLDGYLYGRGTSDNKGPIIAAIYACAELMSEQGLGSDIIFLIEGEEECGSRGFEKAIKASKENIGDIDWILLANSYWLDDRIPCLTYGLRGVIHAKVQVESSHPDMHSGVDGSAQLDEPLKDLVMLLSRLTGKNGEVMVPGFYDPIPELSCEEEALYSDITTALLQRNPDLGSAQELAASLMRRWRDASLTIHRFQSSGAENASVIPRMARADISMRLVPNQEAAQIAKTLDSYLRKEFATLESNNSLTVTIDHQAEPWLGDWRNQIYKTLEEAIIEAWGPIEHAPRRTSVSVASPSSISPTSSSSVTKPAPTTSSVLANGSAIPPITALSTTEEDGALEAIPNGASPRSRPNSSHRPKSRTSNGSVNGTKAEKPQLFKPLYIREGGSIPAIRFLEKEFNAPAAHFPCGQASDSAHLDNERLRLTNLYKSRDIFKKVFRELPVK